jgi:hypothetical protein
MAENRSLTICSWRMTDGAFYSFAGRPSGFLINRPFWGYSKKVKSEKFTEARGLRARNVRFSCALGCGRGRSRVDYV